MRTIDKSHKLMEFLEHVLPARITKAQHHDPKAATIVTKAEFLKDVQDGMKVAPMAVRLSPHILSVADWESPLDDPIVRQFVPLKSRMVADHPQLTLDSLHEEGDSPVQNLVHRYPDKVLFLGTHLVFLCS
jgi:lysine 2,3-aminomutase